MGNFFLPPQIKFLSTECELPTPKNYRSIDSIRILFITSNLNSYAGLQELYFLRKRFNRDSIKHMYDGLRDEYKHSLYGDRIANYLEVGNPLKVGDMYADFEATDQFGNVKKLSDFLGKYILLDFTETYCGPCIFSVRELKQISKDYSDSVYIVSFCVDKSNKVWKEGLKRDTPEWTSLWNGTGYYSKTILKYGVQSYPTFFLINPNGKIIETWAGYGEKDIIKHLSNIIINTKNSRQQAAVAQGSKQSL